MFQGGHILCWKGTFDFNNSYKNKHNGLGASHPLSMSIHTLDLTTMYLSQLELNKPHKQYLHAEFPTLMALAYCEH